ncbi:unnamed protein product, partial [Brassica rapa subsp. narinosa]
VTQNSSRKSASDSFQRSTTPPQTTSDSYLSVTPIPNIPSTSASPVFTVPEITETSPENRTSVQFGTLPPTRLSTQTMDERNGVTSQQLAEPRNLSGSNQMNPPTTQATIPEASVSQSQHPMITRSK